MDAWIVWLLVAIGFAVGELVTMGFFLAPFAGGALLAAALAALGASTAVIWAAFLLGSVLLLVLVRPIARAHRDTPTELRTGTAALIGHSAVVIERIANFESTGCVRIGDEVWTARALSDEDVIEIGAHVRVAEIRGATALVSQPHSSEEE